MMVLTEVVPRYSPVPPGRGQILPSCQDMKTVALYLHQYEYSWVVKIRNS